MCSGSNAANRLGGKEEVKCDSPRTALAQVSPRFQDHVEEMTPATRAVDENLALALMAARLPPHFKRAPSASSPVKLRKQKAL